MITEITKGKGRFYFDGVDLVRMDYGGAGPAMKLTADEMLTVSKALWYAAKAKSSIAGK